MTSDPDQALTQELASSAGGPVSGLIDSSLGDVPPEVAGYSLVRELGRGGMGVVWEAIEHRFDRRVALKVQATGDAPVDAWGEARLAAKIAHPGIVPVHDVGQTLDGRPYYTMDLVDGTELSALIIAKALDPQRAVRIALEIAQAVGAAHSRGVVHCDLKPGNVMIDSGGRVRVLDFGLAGLLQGNDRGAVLAGTPPYMAPEQLTGEPVGTAADVYAIGVILYQMLTGSVLFHATTVMELVSQLATQTPPPPSAKNPEVHADLDRVCLRCVARDEADRYANAGVLAAVLDALIEGRPIDDADALGRDVYAPVRPQDVAPVAAPARDAAPLRYRWTFELRARPEKLWPLVADTERFNRAAGLAEVSFRDAPDPRGGSRRTGEMRVMGMTLAWDEHPFEWSEGREHSVFRDYRRGPLARLWNRVTLRPREAGGTELTHEVWAEPRGVVGRVAAFFELGLKAPRQFGRVYRRMDAYLAREEQEVGADPFDPPHRPDGRQAARIDQGLRRLTEVGFSAAAVKPLSELLLFAPDKRLEKLRPYELADAWGVSRDQVLDMMLHAAHGGLLTLAWDLVCTSCLLPHETQSTLRLVEHRGRCVSCNRDTERDLATTVELSFRPAPEVRAIASAMYCAGAPARRPHVVSQQVLAAGETRAVVLALARGDYRVVGARHTHRFRFSASPAGYADACEVALDGAGVSARPAVVRVGEVAMTLVNRTDVDQIFRVERQGVADDAVSAAAAMSHASFLELFPDEVLPCDQHLPVSRMPFIRVEVLPDPLIREYGDAPAFEIVERVHQLLRDTVRAHQGAVVEVTATRALAAFSRASLAARAMLALLDVCHEQSLAEYVRISLHDGPCIAVTLGGRVGYFGETLQRADALVADAPPAGFCASAEVADRREVAALLQGRRGVEVTTSTALAFSGHRVVRWSTLPRLA